MATSHWRPPQRLSDAAIWAVRRNDYVTLGELVTISTANTVDESGRPLLTHIVLHGDVRMVRWMLNLQPLLDRQDQDGWAPLHFAAQQYAMDIAAVLLDAGASIDLQDKYGNTPLWRATFESRGRGDMIRLLLARGADAERENYSGISPKALAHTIANFDVKQFFA